MFLVCIIPLFDSGATKNALPKPEGRFFAFSEQADHKGNDHKADGHPLGHLGQLGVPALGLVLGHEGVGHAGDGAGQARALTGLEQHHGDQENGGGHVNNAQNQLRNAHDTSSFRPR